MTEEKKKAERFLTIADLWHLCAARWRWFVFSVCACLAFAAYYLYKTPNMYKREASIMVIDESLGKNSTESYVNEFNQIGFVNQNNSVPNVVRHICSLDIMMEVAHRIYPDIKGDVLIQEAESILSRFSADMEDPKSTVVNLVYKDYSVTKAEETLALIIQVYDEKKMEEKAKVSKTASHFIDLRLQLLERDLDRVDDSIATYKSRYGITELSHVGDVYLQQQSQSDAQILALSNQKGMAEYIRDILTDKQSQHQFVIANSGINNALIENQITLYNNLLLQLQSHLEYTSDQNPLIVNKEKELSTLRKNILVNINSHIRTIDIQLQAIEGYNDEATSKITSNPAQAKYLESIEREKKVKESLYLYLLQKKEENEISVTYQTPTTRIIDVPNGSYKPASPQRKQILMAAVLAGLLLPVTVLFMRATFDESVRDHFDIENNSDMPLLGEVPYAGREHSIDNLLMRFGHGRKVKTSGIVVGYDMLDAPNEAFRIIRNNMEAIRANKALGGMGRVYLVKSTQIESGKTFVAMNLALTKAIGGRRVLFIDGDLRQASASRLWRTPLLGLTDYLHGEADDYHRLLFHYDGCPMLDVLPSGALPHNPTEMLRSPLLPALFESARKEYDSIIIDSPSAGMLADADIIESLVDCTLFVIRAGRFNRRRLHELTPVHSRDNVKPQYVILNGVSLNVRYGSAYLHKYERTESDKKETEVSKRTILLNKIIFRKNNSKKMHNA